MSQIFATQVMDEWGDTTYALTPAGYIALIIIMIVILILGCLLRSGKETEKKAQAFPTKQLVFSAMAIALATVTSYLKIIHMPMGGSVTVFSMLCITLIGYWYGLGSGLCAAVAYGFLQLIIDPYIISIPQMLVDYIFAFGALGLSGVFTNSKHGLIKGYILGVLGRYFFSFLSGWIFFGMYAADYNMSAPIYSLVYNGAYLGLEGVFTIILIAIPPVAKALGTVKSMALNENR
ncbi:MAG: energy-coupled thiamine transporter ThiT [Lachnospiraceae bacterium]|nr:energy-coupled thiamine transporter ThiT [Lachnospiraceae bacterium]